MLFSFFIAAIIEVATSGKEVPNANTPRPITVSLIPKQCAKSIEPSINKLAPNETPIKPDKNINIDLDKDNIDLFNSYRKSDFNLATGVSDKEGEADLYFYHKKSALNTISKQNADFQKAEVSTIKKIKTQTINKIIENSPYKDKKIDFLTVDVEGSELSILKNFDFKKYLPKVIVVEYLDLSLKKLEIKNLNINNIIKSDIYKLIISNNYTLANVLHSDLVFIQNNFKD